MSGVDMKDKWARVDDTRGEDPSIYCPETRRNLWLIDWGLCGIEASRSTYLGIDIMGNSSEVKMFICLAGIARKISCSTGFKFWNGSVK